MSKLTIVVGRELFRFQAFQEWVDKAKSRFSEASVTIHDSICVDAEGRLCRYGKQFRRAEQEDTFPIVVYHCDAEGDGGPSDAL